MSTAAVDAPRGLITQTLERGGAALEVWTDGGKGFINVHQSGKSFMVEVAECDLAEALKNLVELFIEKKSRVPALLIAAGVPAQVLAYAECLLLIYGRAGGGECSSPNTSGSQTFPPGQNMSDSEEGRRRERQECEE